VRDVHGEAAGRNQAYAGVMRRGGMLAVGLGCSIAYATEVANADSLDLNDMTKS